MFTYKPYLIRLVSQGKIYPTLQIRPILSTVMCKWTANTAKLFTFI